MFSYGSECAGKRQISGGFCPTLRTNVIVNLSWIDDLIHGEKAAGDRFVTEHYARIYRLLRHLTGHTQTAEDLTQQTFVKAWQALPRFRRKAQIATWLHKIAYHEYTHWLRAKRDHATLDYAAELPAPEQEADWERFILPQALAHLTEEQRSVFLLYYLQELSVREISGILDIPSGTVKSRLFSARQNLRDILASDEKEEAFLTAVSTPTLPTREEQSLPPQTLNVLMP
jgi:RNA polymerase sigma-70 factor, ECF subfamily